MAEHGDDAIDFKPFFDMVVGVLFILLILVSAQLFFSQWQNAASPAETAAREAEAKRLRADADVAAFIDELVEALRAAGFSPAVDRLGRSVSIPASQVMKGRQPIRRRSPVFPRHCWGPCAASPRHRGPPRAGRGRWCGWRVWICGRCCRAKPGPLRAPGSAWPRSISRPAVRGRTRPPRPRWTGGRTGGAGRRENRDDRGGAAPCARLRLRWRRREDRALMADTPDAARIPMDPHLGTGSRGHRDPS